MSTPGSTSTPGDAAASRREVGEGETGPGVGVGVGVARPLRIGFAPWMVAGVRTQWENMLPWVRQRSDLHAVIAPVEPYKPHGLLERSPLPATIAGNIRVLQCGGALFRAPRLDALWVGEIRSAMPYLLSRGRGTPVVYTADSTSAQQAGFGYYAKSSNQSAVGRARDALERLLLAQATVLNPWSEWAARSMRDDYGIPPQRIRVIPPGIDLARWPVAAHGPHHGRPPATDRAGTDPSPDRVLRLLFVGGDFVRKGGDLLLDVFAHHLQGRCELHLVTRDPVPSPPPGVFVYPAFAPNDDGLRALYASCDVFVLPTRADVFSLASMEAMASGLPVIVSDLGGISEIVAEGVSGYLIAPDDGTALLTRITALEASPDLRVSMGRAGRRIAEQRFDAAANTARLLDLLVGLAREPRRRRR